MKRFVLALLGAALLVTGCTGKDAVDVNNGGEFRFVAGTPAGEVIPVEDRQKAPEFGGQLLDGTEYSSSDLSGAVAVINFWGSWCPPCRDESPTLAILSQQYGKHGVSFLGDDVGDSTVNALAFIRNIGISYPSVNDSNYSVVAAFNKVAPVSDTPTTLVIDKTGHVAGVVIGKVTYQGMTTMLHDVGASA